MPINNLKNKFIDLLHWSEKYTRTDMVYLAKGGFWLTLGLAISSISTLVLAIAFANILPKETYGTYKYLQSTIGLLYIFSLSGVNVAIIPSIARGYDGLLPKIRAIKIKWAFVGAIISLGTAVYYVINVNYIFAAIYAVAALIFPFWESAEIYGSYLTGKTDFGRSTKFFIVQNVTTTAALIALALASKNFLPLILTYVISQAFFANFFYLKTIKSVKAKPKEDEQEEKNKILNYSKHLTIMNVWGIIADKIDSIVVFQFLGPAQLAVYSFAIAMPEQIKGLMKNIVPLSMPKFAQRPIEEIKENIWVKIGYMFATTALMMIAYILLAPYIYKLLFPQYFESVKYSQVFAVTLLTTSITLITSILQAHAKVKLQYITNVINPAISIVFLTLGAWSFGVWGIIYAQIISRTLIGLIYLFILYKKM